MIIDIEGIVIKETEYGETSKILQVFTKEYGVIGVIAKGSRNYKSPLFNVSNIMLLLNLQIYYKENKLSILKSADVINDFRVIRKDILKISYASFITDLVSQVYNQSKSSEMYDLLKNSLIKINEDFDPLVITNVLEVKLLTFLGVTPELNECVSCGSKEKIITISLLRGGLICSNCHENEVVLSTKSVSLLRMYYFLDIAKISNVNIKDVYKKEINKIIDEYYEEYTGLYLKSKKFLDELLKLS